MKVFNKKQYIKPELEECYLTIKSPMLGVSDNDDIFSGRVTINSSFTGDFDADAKSRGVVTMSHDSNDFSDDDDALW